MPEPEQIALTAALAVLGARFALRNGRAVFRKASWRRRRAELPAAVAKATSTNQAKMLVARALLPWPWATIWIDGFAPGVVVPEAKRSAWLVLQLGEDMPTPIGGLTCNEAGIGGTLSFDGQPANTWVPWEAVFAIGEDHRHAEWSWMTSMAPESRERVSRAIYGRSLRCPRCERPPLGDTWVCDACEERFDPFVGGVSSTCRHPTPEGVHCRGCGQLSPVAGWHAADQP